MATKKKAAKKPINFYVWLRSALRSMSRKWPPIYEALASAKEPYKGDNKRRQWSYRCAECKGLFESKLVAVDHKVPAGQLLCKEDVGDFVERLFCAAKDLQVLCKPCHDVKTYMERHGGTVEEALVSKEIIRLMKKENRKELLALLQEHGYTGCTNDVKRKAALTEILKEKK